MGLSKPCRLTCVLGHVVLELVDPLALVATVRAQILPFLFMDPHMVLKEGRAKNMPRKMWVLKDKEIGEGGRKTVGRQSCSLLPSYLYSRYQPGSPVWPL